MKRILLKEVNQTVPPPPSNTFIDITTNNQINNSGRPSLNITDNLPESGSAPVLSQAIADSLFNSLTDALIILNRDLLITRLNQSALNLTGYSSNELVGHSIKMLLPDDESLNLPGVEKLLAKNRPVEIETSFQTKNKEIISVLFSAAVTYHTDGSIESISCLVKNFADRWQIEEDLRENVARFRDLFDNAPVAYHELDTDGRFTRINHTEELLLGYTNEELKGRYPWEIIVEEVSRDAIAAKLAGKQQLKPVERTFIRKDGTPISILNEDRLIYDVDGNITGIRSTLQDITERKRAEAESQVIFEIIQGVSTTPNLDELLQHIHQSIGKILYAENCFVALYDAKTELLNMQFFVDKYDESPPPLKMGRGMSAYVFRNARGMLMTPEVISRLIAQGEMEMVGTPPAIWLGVPLRIPTGVIGVLVVQHYENKDAYNERDLELLISVGDQIALAIERKQAEDQLKIFNEKLQQSNRELQDFAYVASHDLQEPLRKIQAFGDRLDKKYSEILGDAGSDYIKRMRDAASRMQTLIQDLLTFSRVTTKAQPFVPVNLENITREVLSDLEVSIEQAGALVQLDSLPVIDADALQMRQLMQNLIGNALKFRRPDTPPVVKISSRIPDNSSVKKNPHGAFCEITVEDNGIGFEEKYLDRIFTVFQRLHGRGEYDGSGVGLAVCRKIVERHNGSITAKSTPDAGATFIITLPIKQINLEIN